MLIEMLLLLLPPDSRSGGRNSGSSLREFADAMSTAVKYGFQ